jgi:DNA-binding beta-propeller fold protein YncE
MKLPSVYLIIALTTVIFSCSKKKDPPQECMECPVIHSISPTIGKVGDTITINGSNFADAGNRVRFNGKETKTIQESSTLIKAYVPANCGTGPVMLQRPDQLISNEFHDFTEIYTFTVSTYAGMPGSASWYDGPITYCFLNTPSALAIDREGSLIICDERNYCVRKISNGMISTIAGKHGNPGYQDSPDPLAALFNTPVGLAISPSNSIFISDHKNHSIRNLAPIGFVTPSSGDPQFPAYANGTGSNAHYNYPGKMLMLDDNTFAIIDSANSRIRKSTIKGEVTLLAGNGKPGSANGDAASAGFNLPSGMALLDTKLLLISDAGNAKIRIINLVSGEVKDFAGYGKSGFFNGSLEKAMFNHPSGIAVRDMNGKKEIFIADTDNNMIRMIDSQNMVSTVIGDLQPGSTNGDGITARLNGPADIVVDPSNNGILYIADKKNHTIRKVIIE